MKTDGVPELVEIIEIIDDDTDAFGTRQRTTTTVHDVGGPRWVGPVAAGALAAFIAYGVVTSASSNSVPVAAPVTSTTVSDISATTTPSRGAVPPATVAFYAAEPPRQFSVQYANVQVLDHAPFEGYAYELWATPKSSAIAGSWFSVATYRGASALTAPDSYRVQSGRLSIAISHTPGGPTIAQYTQDGRMGVTITSFGWSDDDIVRLATSIQADERSISFTDVWFKPAHQLISTVQPWLALQSVPAEQIVYGSSADPSNNIVITVGQQLQPREGGAPELRRAALRFLLDRNTPFTVDGNDAVAGAVVSESGRALATWVAGNHIITVSATMPVSQLIPIARTVHEVSPQEWNGMKFQAFTSQASGSRYERSQSHDVASGTDATLSPWDISVATATSGGQRQLSWSWNSNGYTSTPNGTPQIHTVVDGERTYVLADLPRNIAGSGTLLVSRAGVDVTVPFVDTDPDADRTFAAYAFSEPGPFTVKIIGPDADIRAIWPTT